jgi:hypothetical protein
MVSRSFVSDLAQIHAGLPVASDVNLFSLAERFHEWRRLTKEFVRTERAKLSDDDPLLCPVSLFRTMDYGRLETAHTRTLAWMLDPRKHDEHGFGSTLLVALLRRLAGRDQFDRLHVERVECEFPLHVTGGRGRLDVLAEGVWESTAEPVPWTLIVEAKVDAWEGEGQLVKYDNWCRVHAAGRECYRVFLTPEGHAPDTGVEEWESLSYLDLVRIFRGVYDSLRAAPGFHFLRFYLAGVIQDICRWPKDVTDSAADPYAVASYLKTLHTFSSDGDLHDVTR